MTEATPEAGDEHLAATTRDALISPSQAVFSGFRQPVVAVLLLIALCTAISGKPLDGVLMVTVAMLLVFDAARTRLRGLSPASLAHTANLASFADSANTVRPAQAMSRRRPASRQRTLGGLAAVVVGALYAGFVGAFSRFSWPATIAVVAAGSLVVAIGWQGPLRHRPALTGTARRRSRTRPSARSRTRCWLAIPAGPCAPGRAGSAFWSPGDGSGCTSSLSNGAG